MHDDETHALPGHIGERHGQGIRLVLAVGHVHDEELRRGFSVVRPGGHQQDLRDVLGRVREHLDLVVLAAQRWEGASLLRPVEAGDHRVGLVRRLVVSGLDGDQGGLVASGDGDAAVGVRRVVLQAGELDFETAGVGLQRFLLKVSVRQLEEEQKVEQEEEQE